ncbi:MAG: hypothetical protein Q9163_002785 [Psora crenata]
MAFFSLANGHITMSDPPPYGGPSTSPLDPSGSDFPCKSTTNVGPTTEMAIGAPQTLKFHGSAVHGGGSCQISLTTDNPATKASKWMVIHSIVGGCPARNQVGNMPAADPNAAGPDTYDYKIPDGIAPGTYTLAWTWYNRVGNREMYMNCANIKVTGGSSKRDTYDNETYAVPQLSERDTSFPDMFIANTPTSNCVTQETMDLEFPHPGESVDKAGTHQLAPPTGPKCDAGPAGIPSSGTTPSGNSGAGAGQGTDTQALVGGSGGGSGVSGLVAGSGQGSGTSDLNANGQSAGSGQGSGTSGSGVDGSGAATPSGGLGTATASSPAGSSSAGAAASSVPTGASNSSGSSSTGSGAPPTGTTATSCTTPGESICSPDGRQIGTCDSTLKVVMEPVPASTVCKGGLIQVCRLFRS